MDNALRKSMWVTAILVWTVCAVGIASAQDAAGDDSWKFFGELYFWGASVDGKSATGSDVALDFDDVISDVNFAFMGAAGVSKGKWSLGADLIYVNVDDSDDIAPGVSANVELTNWVITPLVGYRIADTGKSRLDIVGGARYLYLEAELRIDALGARVDDSGSNWDAVVGARGSVDFANKWYLFGYLDIGTGESDLTWQALGGLNYRFEKFDAVVGYRYLYWDFDDSPTFDDLNLSGPYAGVKVRF